MITIPNNKNESGRRQSERRINLALCIFFVVFGIAEASGQALPSLLKTQDGDASNKKSSNKHNIQINDRLTSPQERLDTIREKLSNLYTENTQNDLLPAGAIGEEVDEYKKLHEKLIEFYELQARSLEQTLALSSAKNEINKQASEWTGFRQTPPFSIDLADNLWQKIKNTDQELETLQMAYTEIDKALEDAKKSLLLVAPALQQSAEQLNDNTIGKSDAVRKRWLLTLNQLRNQVAKVETTTREAQRAALELRIDTKKAERSFLIKKLDMVSADIEFTKKDLDSKIEELNTDKLAIEKEIKAAESEDQEAYIERTQTQEQLKRLRYEAESASHAAPDQTIKTLALEQQLNLLTEKAETTSIRLRLLYETNAFFRQSQFWWQKRFELTQRPGAKFIEEILIRLENEIERLNNISKLAQSIQFTFLQKIIDIQEKQNSLNLNQNELKQNAQLNAIYRKLLNTLVHGQTTIEKYLELLDRTQFEAERLKRNLSFMERVNRLVEHAGEIVEQLADFEIYSISDTIVVDGAEIAGTRRVTLGEMSLFLLIISVGFWLASWLVQHGQRTARTLFGLNADSAALAARLVHIVLIVGVVLMALTTMKIPLTVFAFLGGAMALAIGFGAQNLLNNFVSGLILLIERPVKMGDIVEVEGVSGRITQVGARCCQIRRMDGIEMLVPNSAMIEKTVTNWTLSDKKRRLSVTIGIAYGSPVEQAQQLIEMAVRGHSDVMDYPSPLVLFEDFGESALVFTVYYWLDLAKVIDRLVVASEIRVSLNKSLTEAGIVIAFPQRDVHLHSARPIEVVVASSGANESSSLKS